MKKLLVIIISVFMLFSTAMTKTVSADEGPNENSELKIEEISKSFVLSEIINLNYSIYTCYGLGTELIFDEYTPATWNVKRVVLEYDDTWNRIISSEGDEVTEEFNFSELGSREDNSILAFNANSILNNGDYLLSVTDTDGNSHQYIIKFYDVKEIEFTDGATYYVNSNGNIRFVVNNSFTSNDDVFAAFSGNVGLLAFDNSLVYASLLGGKDDIVFTVGDEQITLKTYDTAELFNSSSFGFIPLQCYQRYYVPFDFVASINDENDIYLSDSSINVEFENISSSGVYMTIKDSNAAGRGFNLCVNTDSGVKSASMYIDLIPETYNPETGIQMQPGNQKKVVLENASDYIDINITNGIDESVNFNSTSHESNRFSVSMNYDGTFSIYAGQEVPGGDYTIQLSKSDASSVSFALHVVSNIGRDSSTAIVVDSLEELKTAVQNLLLKDGGLIRVTGMDEVNEDILLTHVYPITDFTNTTTDPSDPYYEKFLMIDLQCNIDLGSHQLVLPAMSEQVKGHTSRSDTNVIIIGNGHTITSSNAEATVKEEGVSHVLFKNVKIVNTHEIEQGETENNACALKMTDGSLTADSNVSFVGPTGVIMAEDGGKLHGLASLKGTAGPALLMQEGTYGHNTIKNASTEAEDNIAIVNNGRFYGEGENLIIEGEVDGTIVWNNGKLKLTNDASITSESDCIRIDSDAVVLTDDSYDIDRTAIYIALSGYPGNYPTLNSTFGSCIKEVSSEKSILSQLVIPDGNFTCLDSTKEIFDLGSNVTRNENGIDITGGNYSKMIPDAYFNTSRYSWNNSSERFILARNSAISEALVASYEDFVNAIEAEADAIKLIDSFAYAEERDESHVIDIPYPIEINLNGCTLSGYTLKFSKVYGVGVTAQNSTVYGGTLIAEDDYVINNLSSLRVNNVTIQSSDEYQGFVARSGEQATTFFNGCTISGTKGIDLARTATYTVNTPPLQFGNTEVITSDVAVSDENSSGGQHGIAVNVGAVIRSTNNTAIKSTDKSFLHISGTVEGLNAIETNGQITLEKGAVIRSVAFNEELYDVDENAAIITSGFGSSFTSNGAAITSQSNNLLIINGEYRLFEINGGSYKSLSNIFNEFDETNNVSVSRGQFSSEINAEYLPEGWSCIAVDDSDTPYTIVLDLGTKTVGAYTVSTYLNAEDVSASIDTDTIKEAVADENIEENTSLIFNASEESEEKIEELEEQINKEIVDCYDFGIVKKTTDAVDGDSFIDLHTTNESQIITVDLSNEAKASIDDLAIYHEDEQMSKVPSYEELVSYEGDCAYIDEEAGKAYVKTSSFSSFSFVKDEEDYSKTITYSETLPEGIKYPSKVTFYYDGNPVKDAANIWYAGVTEYDNVDNYTFGYGYTDADPEHPYDREKISFEIELTDGSENDPEVLVLDYFTLTENYVVNADGSISVLMSEPNVPLLICPFEIEDLKFYKENEAPEEDEEVTFDEDKYGHYIADIVYEIGDAIHVIIRSDDYAYDRAELDVVVGETKTPVTVDRDAETLEDRCARVTVGGKEYLLFFEFEDEQNYGPETVIEYAKYTLGEDEYPLSCYSDDTGTIFWDLDWQAVGEEAAQSFSSIFNSSFEEAGIKLVYKAGDTETTVDVDKTNFVYNNEYSRHGYKYVAQNGEGENEETDVFLAGYINNAISDANFNRVFIKIGNTEYEFTETETIGNLKIYMIDEDCPLSLIYNNQLNFEYDNYTLNYENGFDCIEWIDEYREARGTVFYYTDGTNHDKKIALVYEFMEQDVLEDSFIRPYDEENVDYRVEKDDSGNYLWFFNIDPADYFSTNTESVTSFVYLVNSGKHDDVTFEQVPTGDDYNVPQRAVDKDSDGEYDAVELKLRKYAWSEFNITGTDNGSDASEVQSHTFVLSVNVNDVYDYTLINGFEGYQSIYINTSECDQITDGIIGNVSFNLNSNQNIDELKNIVMELDPDTDYQDENYEDGYFSVNLKDNVSITGKYYSYDEENDNILVIYKLEDGNSHVEYVKVYFYGTQGGWGGNVVYVDGEPYIPSIYFKNGRSYKVYQSNGYSFNAEKLLEATGYEYPVLFVNAQMQGYYGEDERDSFYEEGIDYCRNEDYVYEVYEPVEGTELSGDIAKENLERIYTGNTVTVYKYRRNNGGYSECKDSLDYLIDNPMYYIDEEGSQIPVTVYTDYDSFITYNGDGVAAYGSISKSAGQYEGNLLLNTRLFTTVSCYGRNWQSQDLIVEGEDIQFTVGEGESTADKLVQAISALEDKATRKIVLNENITLDKDVIIRHAPYWDAEGDMSTNSDYGLAIDLNGHTLNTAGHTIDIADNSAVYFINSDTENTGIVTGETDTLIRNYGRLYAYGDVKFINTKEHGTAITQYNTAYNLNLNDDTAIEAGIAIKVVECSGRTEDSSTENMLWVTSSIDAEDYIIYFDCPEENGKIRYMINLQKNIFDFDANVKQQMTSDNVGIYVKGSPEVYLNNIYLKAAVPFEVYGGKYDIDFSDIIATEENGAVIKTNSQDRSAQIMQFSFSLNSLRVESAGSIIKDAAETGSKIKKVDFYTTSSETYDSYFDYAGEHMFINVPEDVINIYGGNYSNMDFGQYIDYSFVKYLNCYSELPEDTMYSYRVFLVTDDEYFETVEGGPDKSFTLKNTEGTVSYAARYIGSETGTTVSGNPPTEIEEIVYKYAVTVTEEQFEEIIENSADYRLYFDENANIGLSQNGPMLENPVFTANHKSVETISGSEKTFYGLRTPNNYAQVKDYDELVNALSSGNIFMISLDSDINAPENSKIDIELSHGVYIAMNSHSIRNVEFTVSAEDPEDNKAVLSLENGEFSNNGTVLNIESGRTILRSIGINSEGIAVKVKDGSLTAWDNGCSIRGAVGMLVNSGDLEESNIRIELSKAEIEGTSNAAIMVEKVAQTDDTYNSINFFTGEYGNSKIISSAEKNDEAVVAAIYVKDNINIYINNADITSNNYGVYFDDSISGNENNNNCYLNLDKGATIEAETCVRLCKQAFFSGNGATLKATNNTFEATKDSRYHIASGYYSAQEGNIFDFYGNANFTFNHNIYGGYFSQEIDENTITINGNSDYTYECVQVEDDTAEYPYVVAKKAIDKKSYQSVSLSFKREITIDDALLEGAVSQAERDYLSKSGKTVEVVMTVKEESNQDNLDAFEEIGDFNEIYDIHINKNIGDEKKRVDEVDAYQLIKVSLDSVKNDDGDILIEYTDPDNVVIYHKHKDAEPQPMKKIEVPETTPQEECYYITSELVSDVVHYYANIVTKRFSTFAIGETNEEVAAQTQKTVLELELNYSEEYLSGNTDEPATAKVKGPQGAGINSISIDKVDVVYTNCPGTEAYYDREFPAAPGQYTVTWTIKNSENVIGQASQTFSVIATQYDIIYNLNGGSNNDGNPAVYDVTGDDVVLLAPTKKGNIFRGWFTEEGFENQIETIAASLYRNINVFAKWVKLGDINNDGKVDSADRLVLRNYVLGKITSTAAGFDIEAADLNGDQKINGADRIIIRNIDLGRTDLER